MARGSEAASDGTVGGHRLIAPRAGLQWVRTIRLESSERPFPIGRGARSIACATGALGCSSSGAT